MRTRLGLLKPFACQIPMVPAASISMAAQTAIERELIAGRIQLRQQIERFLSWLRNGRAQGVAPADAQRRFTLVRMRFNAILADLDLFSDLLTQRSEHEIGAWLAGLDVVAADALRLRGGIYEAPPVMCYIDRGPGASIRRARTRLPGGGRNPVAIVRVPRERMVGSGIASSLVHEVGHQAADLLDLANSVRPILHGMRRQGGPDSIAWLLWERWLGEVVADFWSVAVVGVASTMGLIGVVSLPNPFVFRVNLNDPHPPPWVRVRMSCAIGQTLYPHPQWAELDRIWRSFYPIERLSPLRRQLFGLLARTMPAFVAILVNHRPGRLRGRTMREVIGVADRQPAQLLAWFEAHRRGTSVLRSLRPTLVFAVIGQAKAAGRIAADTESRLLSEFLSHWAVRECLVQAGRFTEIGVTARGGRPAEALVA